MANSKFQNEVTKREVEKSYTESVLINWCSHITEWESTHMAKGKKGNGVVREEMQVWEGHIDKWQLRTLTAYPLLW